MSVLSELQESVAAVADAVGPSVVGIGSRLRGSGVVIADGRVLTNAHNLRGAEVTVRFADGRAERGAVKGVDWDGDLAVVEVDPISYVEAGRTELERLAYRLWLLDRGVLRGRLARLGIAVARWGHDTELDAALEGVRTYRRRARLARV